MTPQDFSPEELDRLRQLAKRAADDQQWAASLEDPGDRGDRGIYEVCGSAFAEGNTVTPRQVRIASRES